jgi:hypothetical protein
VDPVRIKDIPVWGTVQEGRVLPVRRAPGSSSISKLGPVLDQPTLASLNRAEAVKEQMPGLAHIQVTVVIQSILAQVLAHRQSQLRCWR